MRIYRLYKLLNDCRTSFFRQGSPFKQKHNTSILYSKQLSIDNDPRLIYGENTKSLSCRHELSHHYNNMSGTDKFIKNKEKIEESDMESYKDVENSFYNEFSEDKIEGNNKNPLEMFNNGIFSHQSNDRVKIDIETLKEKSPRKYVKLL